MSPDSLHGKRVDEPLHPLPGDEPHPGLAAFPIVDFERRKLLCDEQAAIGTRGDEIDHEATDLTLRQLRMIEADLTHGSQEDSLPEPDRIHGIGRTLGDGVPRKTHHSEYQDAGIDRIGIQSLGTNTGLDGLRQLPVFSVVRSTAGGVLGFLTSGFLVVVFTIFLLAGRLR